MKGRHPAFCTTLFPWVRSGSDPTLAASSSCSPLDMCHPFHLRPGDLDQVGRDNPPADPAAHPLIPMIAAPIQFIAAPQHANPPLDASPEPKAPAEPPLVFLLLPLL